MIDQIGGWSSVRGVGARYGQGYDLDQIRVVMGAVVGSKEITRTHRVEIIRIYHSLGSKKNCQKSKAR